MPGHGYSIAAITVVEPVNAPEVFRIGLVRADRFEIAYDRGRDARRIGEFAPVGQGDLRRAQAFDRPSAAIAVKDFRPDEEWFRHGADAAPLARLQPLGKPRRTSADNPLVS
jgi:hypothetical protein